MRGGDRCSGARARAPVPPSPDPRRAPGRARARWRPGTPARHARELLSSVDASHARSSSRRRPRSSRLGSRPEPLPIGGGPGELRRRWLGWSLVSVDDHAGATTRRAEQRLVGDLDRGPRWPGRGRRLSRRRAARPGRARRRGDRRIAGPRGARRAAPGRRTNVPSPRSPAGGGGVAGLASGRHAAYACSAPRARAPATPPISRYSPSRDLPRRRSKSSVSGYCTSGSAPAVRRRRRHSAPSAARHQGQRLRRTADRPSSSSARERHHDPPPHREARRSTDS